MEAVEFSARGKSDDGVVSDDEKLEMLTVVYDSLDVSLCTLKLLF